MVKASRSSKALKSGAVVRSVDPKVVEFLEAAGAGDLSRVKRFIKAGKFEIDEGEGEKFCFCMIGHVIKACLGLLSRQVVCMPPPTNTTLLLLC